MYSNRKTTRALGANITAALKSLTTLAFGLLFSLGLAGQSASIRGTVIDDATGETLIGVGVLVDGTSAGAATDLDGVFDIKIEPGNYQLRISYIGYAEMLVKDVVLKAGESKFLGVIRVKENTATLDEVVVTAAMVRETEVAILTVKRKAANMLDGASAANFKKMGDSDAGAALKRVTGVSVEGGKYVYVRGLGDRYTKTTLNNMDVPGLDPDRNSVQMDIFPTNLISNIMVSKSSTADQPADFTGGVVNVELHDFPDERAVSFGLGLGYNPGMHFNSNYLSYQGSNTDFLGFDNGQRAIPTGRRTNIPQFATVIGNPNGPQGQDYQDILAGFNPTMAGDRNTSLMDFGGNFSFADVKSLKKYKLGYSFALTYKNEREFYEDAEFNLFAKAASPDQFELIPIERQRGDFGVNNVLVGAMGGLALKSDLSKIGLNILHLQNGESKAGNFDFVNTNLGANFEATQYNLEYSQRSLTNILLSGRHFLKSEWNLNWKIAPTRSAIIDPDIRFLRFREPNQTVGTEVGLPERIWRYLEEYNFAGRFDLDKDFRFLGREAKVRTGSNYVYKVRDFDIQNFQFMPGNTVFTGDPSELFDENNLFSADNSNGVRYEPLFIPTNPNTFTSSVSHLGLYASNEFFLSEGLKTVVGLRVESYMQYYTGTNQTGSIALNNERVINDFDFFPSLNMIYALSEMQNLRFSASQTIARPTFKEMSFAEILDPITGRTFIGSMLTETTNGGQELLWDGNLESTRIINLDFRWELFQELGQMFSVSAFFKRFDKPIEMVQYLADPGSFQARNVGDATMIGLEFEVRKSLAFVSPSLERYSFNTNVTVNRSEISLSESEFRSRNFSARDGEEVEDSRVMAGQAPYVINAGFSYLNPENKFEYGVYYNVQGPTLLFVGFGNRADVFSVPFHSLNLSAGKSFGKEDRMRLSLKASNLLNDEREQVFRGFQAEDQLFTRLRPQRVISLSFSMQL